MTSSLIGSDTELVARAVGIARAVAGPHADEVDANARFPREAIDALREARMLSALVPARLGGGDATVVEVADAVFALARSCASTALIFAMHQVAVACLVRHGTGEHIERFLHDLAERQLLVASATTELGTGGDVSRSICAVERAEGRFHLEKEAPVVSYGGQADAIVVTARRDPESASTDQVMVLCAAPDVALAPLNGWDVMGFRGTCSSGFRILAEGDEAAVLPVGFDVISARTNLPLSHVLWSHVWLGLAAEATERARTHVQRQARKHLGVVPPAAARLAELDAQYRQMASLVRYGALRYEEIADEPEALAALGFAIEMNALKVSASTLVADVVARALGICGMEGYREGSDSSMGRLLRDAHGAALMLNNDRLLGYNAQMLLAEKGPL